MAAGRVGSIPASSTQPIRLATTVGALRAHIVKHTSGPLNARGSDVAMEQLTLVYERLEME